MSDFYQRLQGLEVKEFETEDDDVMLKHKGQLVQRILHVVTPDHLSLVFVETEQQKQYLYFADPSQKLMEDLNEYDAKTGQEVWGINTEDKKYCLELLWTHGACPVYLNFITTLPKGCADQRCKRLSGLFSILKSILEALKYRGPVCLKDDVQVQGKFITYERIIARKPQWSIYEKYGFQIVPPVYAELLKALEEKDKERLQRLARNIPMMAPNTARFASC